MNKQAIIEHLENLGNGKTEPIDINTGLCGELIINGLLPRYAYHVIELSKNWKNFSGDVNYPIPASNYDYKRFSDWHEFKDSPEPISSEKAAKLAFDNNSSDKWGDHYYGNKRRELCLFLAKQLRKELKEQS